MLLQSSHKGQARPLTSTGHCKARPVAARRVWPFSSTGSGSNPDRSNSEDEQYAEQLQQWQQQIRDRQASNDAYNLRPPQQQQQQQQQQPDLLRTNPKWRWLDGGSGQPQQPQRTSSNGQRSQEHPMRQREPPRQQQQQEQLSAQQQAALRDMIMDATVNPKWRWPSFGNSDNSSLTRQGGPGAQPPPPPPPSYSWPPFMPPQQQQQQQQTQRRGSIGARPGTSSRGAPPPPPPPPPGGYYPQQAYSDTQQQAGEGGRSQQQQQHQRKSKGWLWPFSEDGLTDEDEEYRAQLEAMGVDLVGSRGKEQQAKGGAGSKDVDFEQMDDRQIAAYMDKMRQSRLERAAYKQDDEIVGIVGLYLSVTFAVLALAALANLPL